MRSDAFGDGDPVPLPYAAEAAGGRNVSPPLTWEEVPPATASIAVTVIDRHPVAGDFVHWAVLGLPPDVTALPEAASGSLAGEARELPGTSGIAGWHGPKPPAGSGAHPYEFTVWALASEPALTRHPDGPELTQALQAASLASATIVGTYER